MNKRFAVSIVALGVIALFYLSPKTSPHKAEIHEIVLTEEGYVPEKLTINKGDTVRFRTTRGKPFWPASNLHPTHQIYSEFDPEEPVEPENNWDFRFMKTGTWKFHDHLAPYYTGEIIVKDPGGGTSELSPGACADKDCREEYLLGILNAQGLKAAMSEIEAWYRESVTLAHECHNLAHELGHSAYAVMKKRGELELTPKAAFCSYGFYHGFMESFLLDNENNLQKVSEFCHSLPEEFSGEAPDALMQCFHGVGHGAFRIGSREISSSELQAMPPALRICEAVTTAPLELSRCATGVYNTLGETYGTGAQNISINSDDPLWVCREQPEKYQDPCYVSLNSAVLGLTRGDLVKAAGFLTPIQNAETAAHAMTNLAAIIGAQHIGKAHHEEVINTCRKLESRLRIPCIQGFAYGFLEHGPPGEEYREALTVCGNNLLENEERTGCFDYIFRYFGQWYSKAKITEICGNLPSDLGQKCLSLALNAR